MKFEEAQEEFIRAWGELGSSWGVSKTMAQIHALLLSSSKPLSTEDIMNELNISRGNANMNIRALISWGLTKKAFMPGERKEYFESDKDIWNISKQVAQERKRRELDPMRRVIDELVTVEAKTTEEKEFKMMLKELQSYTKSADRLIDKLSRSDKNWFFKLVMKLI
ncbi:MAG: transcriptional regulator [Flavobacteriales bacterium]|nr:transcriptional regulator [Flavobacteriales bacterium]